MDLMRGYSLELLACVIFVLSLSVTDAASPGNLPTTADPCSPNPCQNRALCRSRANGYSCFCVPGFQGARCQIDVNECVSQPCANGATCVDGVGRYTCLCQPGFTGSTCEAQVDKCQSWPCLNGGSCHDGIHGCENNTDKCQSGPCQNGALCIDGVDEYSCVCTGTAFTGHRCETRVPACQSEPCFNSALCQDNGSNYTCLCWPGFTGRQCEVDIEECGSGPCVHQGRCIEGPLCQELVDHCENSPCQNGGHCENRVGGYICHCHPQHRGDALYGGANCDVKLVGCEGHQCQNGGSCRPFLANDTQGYGCSCPPGFTGLLCQTSTTFSFEGGGYLLLRRRSPPLGTEASCNVTLSFRTVLRGGVLFQRRSGHGLLLRLELRGGRPCLTLRRRESSTRVEEEEEEEDEEASRQTLELPHYVSDREWHSVQALLGDGLLGLALGSCARWDCRVSAPIKSSLAAALVHPFRDTSVGGSAEDSDRPGDTGSPPPFIGCMRDVLVDRQLVVLEEWPSGSAVNVSLGCGHGDRCMDAPCQNSGQCVDLWQSYQCSCYRPYEGPNCEEEYVTARFGDEDSGSYAAFTVTDDLAQDLAISLFLRTRRRTGLLLALGDNNGSAYGQHLRMWLEDGKVKVRVGDSESVASESGVSDGEVRFVSVEVARERMALFVAARQQGYARVRTPDVRAGGRVYVGGLPEERAASAPGGYFKGCIQDLRINDRRLQFFSLDAPVSSFPLEALVNVSAGCSGEDNCSRNPCHNGGQCFSTWDDFSCTCPAHTAGRRCEEVSWCELSPCPAGAVCKMVLDQGYECHTNATLLNDSGVLSYRGNGRITRDITSLTLSLRTRKRHTAVLHAERGSAFITLSVQDGQLFMELHSRTGEEEEEEEGRLSAVSLSSGRLVSDGEWHSVHLFMAAPWANSSHWTMVLDEEAEEARTSATQEGSLNFLRRDVDIFLGGLGPHVGWALVGCLGTVELGGVALPYFSSSEVSVPRLQEEQFLRTSPLPPRTGCVGGAACEPNPCLNGGQCRDLFNLYQCSCPEGWAGRRCDFFTDTCASGPCVHGNCSVRGPGYECDCEFGYAGVDCEVEADVCENHLCAHGGTCLHGPDRYACLCAENFTGPLCNERVEDIPWYIIVRNIRPKLPVSVCGDDTRNYTCFNGGNCTERELSCDCPPGFMGHRCEQEVDECKSNPCLNGGYCRNLINKFVCVCDMSYAGDVCQTDVSDIYFYVAVLLWQNLFQLLSYLILRLDDEPEVDWGGQE